MSRPSASPQGKTDRTAAKKEVQALRRCVRRMVQRSTHSWRLPGPRWNTEYLAEVFREHGLAVEADGECLIVTHRFGRVYNVEPVERQNHFYWVYRTTHDPIGGLGEIYRTQRAEMTLMDAVDIRDPAPADWWWDGESVITGCFLALDLETTPVVDGEFPAIVLGAAANEHGDAVLLTPDQITPFLRGQLQACPHQILCNWNLAGFDLPTLCYRIAGFRERLYERLVDRLYRGYVYDTMLMTQLRDIGLYGMLFSPDSQAVGKWQEGFGNQVYALGPQAKRFLGLDLAKEETLLFWEYLDRPRDIPEDLGSYALEDVIANAAMQDVLHEDADVRAIACDAKREITRLDGCLLQPDPGVAYEDLVLECGLHYGWQSHTIQFLGAVALSWATTQGVAVDIDHIFGIIEDLELQLRRKLGHFGSKRGRTLYRVLDGKRTAVSWIAEHEKPDAIEREIQRLRGLIDDEDDRKAAGFELGPMSQWQVTTTEKDVHGRTVYHTGTKRPVLRAYQFVRQRSINDSEVHAYVRDHLKELGKHVADGQKLDERQFDRIGLQQNQWLVLFGVKEIDQLPDPVLRTKFEIAALKKRIATVKSYLPGFASHPRKEKLRGIPAAELRKRLRLEGVKVGRVYPRYKPLVATGRTGGFEPNIQQVERSTRMRNCFIASSGYRLIVSDYGAAEMVTQAEIYRHRYPDTPKNKRLATILNGGFDPHILTGMKVRFRDEEDIWWPLVSDPDILAVKRAMSREDLRDAINRLRERRDADGKPLPEFEKLDPETREAGEDVAKGLWVNLMAKALASAAFAREEKTPTARELEERTGQIKKDIKSGRQAAKPLNFGIPGGMLPPRIVSYAWTDYKVEMTLKDATRAYDAWLEMYPEGRRWLEDPAGEYRHDRPPFPYPAHYSGCYVLTGRLRGCLVQGQRNDAGEVGYDPGWNEWHNTQFQGHAADGAKLALYYVWHEGITTPSYIHDELGGEAPEPVVYEWQGITKRGMRQAFDDVCDYMQVTVGSAVMERWAKG